MTAIAPAQTIATALRFPRRPNGVDEFGRPVYESEGYVVSGHGFGRMRWTATYPDGSTVMTDSMAEAVAWSEEHAQRHAATIYASTGTRNTDPAPYATADGERLATIPPLDWDEFAATGRFPVSSVTHSPDSSYDLPRAHEGNPVLIAAREYYDGSDPWGFALGWLYAVQRHANYSTTAEVREWVESHEVESVVSLREHDGGWTLPRATAAHLAHAERVFDRMADVARANGRDY